VTSILIAADLKAGNCKTDPESIFMVDQKYSTTWVFDLNNNIWTMGENASRKLEIEYEKTSNYLAGLDISYQKQSEVMTIY
jgi:hypothetical protein